MMQQLKIVIVGDEGVGKTNFSTSHFSGEFTEYYEPTNGVNIVSIPFHTQERGVLLNLWDCAGKDSKYYDGADGVILMFDMSSNKSYKNAVGYWYNSVVNVTGTSIPVVLCGNKCDKDRRVFEENICEMSVKNNINVNKPLLSLLNKIDDDY